MADAVWWNYRIMKRWQKRPDGSEEPYYALVEVHYERSAGEDDPQLSWTVEDIVVGDSPEEVKATILMMLEDSNRPVLNEKSLNASNYKEVNYHGNKR